MCHGTYCSKVCSYNYEYMLARARRRENVTKIFTTIAAFPSIAIENGT